MTEPERLLVLHVWESELSDRQMSAAAALLRLAMIKDQPRYGGAEIDFITISRPERATSRKFRNLDWLRLAPLDEGGLLRFCRQLQTAWDRYQRAGPRQVKLKRRTDLFG